MKNSCIQWPSKVLLLLLVTLLPHMPLGAAGAQSSTQSWLNAYEAVPDDGFMVTRVQMIFEDIKRANDKLVHPSKLYIIKSKGVPWAIALSDKNIILTSGAIDVIYSSNDSLAMKDARMAFVLGHELKHVVDNDFSHARAYEAFSESTVNDLIVLSGGDNRNRKTLELLADSEGLINASLAGYDTSAIFSTIGSSDNFLEYWANQTNTKSGNQHHSAEERIKYLRDSFSSINSQVEFFKYAVRLAHFGDYADSLVLLEDFYTVYESNSVLTNRGYVQLQLARQQMPEQIAYRYWFPDLIDLDSNFPLSSGRTLDPKIPASAVKHLNEAVNLLTRSLQLSSQDLNASLNLVTAYLFLGEYSSARAVIEKIADWETMADLLSLDAMIVTQDKRLKDPWNTYSLEVLEQLASGENFEPRAVYNYARLLQEHGRRDQARPYWARLELNLGALPRNYQVMVCRELTDKTNCSAVLGVDDPIEPAKRIDSANGQWVTQIRPGDDINTEASFAVRKSWDQKPIRSLASINAEIHPFGEGNSLLVIDGRVRLVSLKEHGIDFKENLLQQFGPPSQISDTSTDEIWSYSDQWAALVSGELVREIWIAK